MFNTEKPDLEALPTSAQLLRSTLLAATIAIAILVAVVLPAEYGIDPTGAGKVLGLTEMGEIKRELAIEAEEDKVNHSSSRNSNTLERLLNVLFTSAYADDAWQDTVSFTLEPGASKEIKVLMEKGGVTHYQWQAENGRINFDLHGHGQGESVTYKKGRGKAADQGNFEAPFDGEHGWFWRNRDKQAVTIVLQLRGNYSDVVQQ